MFLGKTGIRTVFMIEIKCGVDIVRYSAFANAEAEVLALLPRGKRGLGGVPGRVLVFVDVDRMVKGSPEQDRREAAQVRGTEHGARCAAR